MGTRTITFCDFCSKERVDSKLVWYTGVLCTDGGEKPAVQSNGLFCSVSCLNSAIDDFLKKNPQEDAAPPDPEPQP